MQLLLPYAHDIDHNLVHINDSQKGQKYTCPHCGAELLLKIGKVRSAHFAHKVKIADENRCSESVLHKQFKEKCSEVISIKIREKQELFFKWECGWCKQTQQNNLLSDVVEVVTEYNLGVCKPDIALLDKEGKVLMAIEIVYSHSPTEKSLKYYEENNIACLKVKISSFEECNNVERVLMNAEKVELYPKRKCEKCNKSVTKIGQGTDGVYRIDLSQTSGGRSLKERLEILLKERENEILCKECGEKMKVLETEFGALLLVCKSFPKCKTHQSVDILLWSDKFQ